LGVNKHVFAVNCEKDGMKNHGFMALSFYRNMGRENRSCAERLKTYPFAICGDRQLLRNRFAMINETHFSQILHFTIQSGDRRNVVGHH
jgi:hypothetical protein